MSLDKELERMNEKETICTDCIRQKVCHEKCEYCDEYYEAIEIERRNND